MVYSSKDAHNDRRARGRLKSSKASLSRSDSSLFGWQRTIPITISEFTISTYSSSSFYLQSSELQRDARPRLQIDTCHGSEPRGKERKKRARNRSRPGNKLDLTTHTHVASSFAVAFEFWQRLSGGDT